MNILCVNHEVHEQIVWCSICGERVDLGNCNHKEKIEQSAIMILSGKIFTGHRHCDCFKKAFEAGEKPPQHEIQGFMTTHGRFVTRKLAKKIATEAGQLEGREKHNPQDILMSEDIY
jgi:hypothetical protein